MSVGIADSRPWDALAVECISTLPFIDSHTRENTNFSTMTANSSSSRHSDSIASNVNTAANVEPPVSACRGVEPQFQAQSSDSRAPSQQLAPPAYMSVTDSGALQNDFQELDPMSSQTLESNGHHQLEDYDGIDITQVDRYGFFAEGVQRQRVQQNDDDSCIQKKHNGLRRKGTISKDALKRASMNLGLLTPTDYLEIPKTGIFNIEKEIKRGRKWTAMARRRQDDVAFDFKMSKKLKKRVYKGIPDCWRASAWSSLVSHRTLEPVSEHELRQQYDLLVASPCEYDSQIDLDVPRTISGHVLFRHRHVGGQRLLFRVLHAIALQYPISGYVQGMASVAAMCLCYYPEDQAFVMLCLLWSERNLSRLYEPGFELMMQCFKSLEQAMATTTVGRHLLKIGCQPLAWATRWYLTLFHISVPFHTQLRIWDIFMLHNGAHGHVQFAVLEATTLALIQGIESVLTDSDFDQAMGILTRPLDVQDDDRLVHAIYRRLKQAR